MNYLDWDRIKEEQCPMCGYQLIEGDTHWTCDNHKQPFKISNERFLEIQRNLQEQEDFSWPYQI